MAVTVACCEGESKESNDSAGRGMIFSGFIYFAKLI